MNPRNILRLVALSTGIAAAAIICAAWAAYALFIFASPYVGMAGAAGVVAAVFALVAVVLALTLKGVPRHKRAPGPVEDESLLMRAMGLAKQRPLVAAAVGAAAIAVMVRNPQILTALLGAALAGKAAKPDR